jgi:VWFA-related protein
MGGRNPVVDCRLSVAGEHLRGQPPREARNCNMQAAIGNRPPSTGNRPPPVTSLSRPWYLSLVHTRNRSNPRIITDHRSPITGSPITDHTLMRRRASILLLALAVLGPAMTLRGQENKLVETIEVRVTNVDVVVTDKQGNPVSGLTKDDFQLFENRKPQTITNFYEVRPNSVQASATAPAEAAAVPPAAAPEPPRDMRRRRIVFFLDEFSSSPIRRNLVIESMIRHIGTLVQPDDEAMLVRWNRALHIVVPFTSDMEKIRKALHELERHSGGSMSLTASKDTLKANVMTEIEMAKTQRGRNRAAALSNSLSYVRTYSQELYAIERSLASAMRISLTTLAGVDGKKVMVYAGEHLPDKPALDMYNWVEQQFMANFNMMPSGAGVAGTAEVSMTLPLEAVAKQANASGVTMYMIDVADSSKGILASAEDSEAQDSTTAYIDFTNTALSFQTLANLTGGIALTQTQNFDLAFQTISRDLDAYYSLGYRSSDDKSTTDRSISVKVRNPQLRVRSRRTYVSKTGEQQTNDRVIANIFQAGGKSEIPIELHAGQPVKSGRGLWHVPVRVAIPATITLLPDGDALTGGFTVFIAVGDEDGSMSDVAKRAQSVRIPATQEASFRQKPITFDMQVEIQNGEHTLSVGVVDQLTNASGFARAKVIGR